MRYWLFWAVIFFTIASASAADSKSKTKKLGPTPSWVNRVEPRLQPIDQKALDKFFTNALKTLQEKNTPSLTPAAKTNLEATIRLFTALASDPTAASKIGTSTMKDIEKELKSFQPTDADASAKLNKKLEDVSKWSTDAFPDVDEVFDISVKEQTVKFTTVLKTATNGVVGLREGDWKYIENRAARTSNFFTVEIYNLSKETNRSDRTRLKIERLEWDPKSIGEQSTFKCVAILRQPLPSNTKVGLRVLPTSTLEKSEEIQDRIDLLKDYLEAIRDHLPTNSPRMTEISNVLSSATATFSIKPEEVDKIGAVDDAKMDEQFDAFDANWADFKKNIDATEGDQIVIKAMIKSLVDLRKIKKLAEFNGIDSVVTAGKKQYIFTDIVQKVSQVPPKDVEVTLGKGIADHFIVLSLQLQNIHTNKLLIYGDGVQVKCQTLALSYSDPRSHKQLMEANLTRIRLPDNIDETSEMTGVDEMLAKAQRELKTLQAARETEKDEAQKAGLKYKIQTAEQNIVLLERKKRHLAQRRNNRTRGDMLATNEWTFYNWRPVKNSSGHFTNGESLMVHSIPLSFMRSGHQRREMNTTKSRSFRVAEFAGGIAAALVPLTGGGPDLGTGIGLYGNVLIPAAHKLFGDTSEVQRQAFESESLDQYLELEVGQTCHKLIYLPRNGIDAMAERRVLFISAVPGMPDGKDDLDELSRKQAIIIKAAIVVTPEE